LLSLVLHLTPVCPGCLSQHEEQQSVSRACVDLCATFAPPRVVVNLFQQQTARAARCHLSFAGLQKALSKVPSAVFEKAIPGVREYSTGARAACVGVKFLEYSLAGMFCGLVGQSIANTAMIARRAHNPDAEYTVDPPPILKTALVWGLFMGVSSNLRYQAVFGLERLVDMTLASKIPQVRSHRPL
jgi:hypothetical protein